MAIERRFLVPSAVARLIQRERGVGIRTIEGYLSARADRTQLVRVDGDQCFLVLRTLGHEGEIQQEEALLSSSQAEALVDVAVGRLAFDRTEVQLGLGVLGTLDRYILPAGLDVLTVSIQSDPRLFMPPAWVGREVSGDPAYLSDRLALEGPPSVDAAELTNRDLEALLDWLEGRSGISLQWPPVDTSAPLQGESPRELQLDSRTASAHRPQPNGFSTVGHPLPVTEEQSHDVEPEQQERPLTYEPATATAAGGEDASNVTRRQPVLRADDEEADASLTRLARSLAPRRRSTS